MISRPKTRYVQSRNGTVAYQMFGSGTKKLLFLPGTFSHLDFMWSDPGYARFLRQLGSFARVVVFDRAGVGLSDRLSRLPALEERVCELEAVLEEVEFKRTAILAFSETGAVAAYFAAANAGRVEAIVFAGAVFKGVEEGVPWALPAEPLRALAEALDAWGEGVSLDLVAPSVSGSRAIRRLWGSFERNVASPGTVKAFLEFIESVDATVAVQSIDVPTLVIARKGDRMFPAVQSRKLAEFVRGAKYVELEGDDHVPWFGDLKAYLDPIEEFLTGELSDRQSETSMETLLFTDIVGSTTHASKLGDAAWVELLARHDALAREVLEKHGGREVKPTGDGFLCTFLGPVSAVRCATEVMSAVRGFGIELRAGIHTGEVTVVRHDLQGIAVNTCARICAAAGAGEILLSSTARNLLGGSISTRPPVVHDLKGVGRLQLFAVDASARHVHVLSSEKQLRIRDQLTLALVRYAPGAARTLMGTLRRFAAQRGGGLAAPLDLRRLR